jgi:hypothetical protein
MLITVSNLGDAALTIATATVSTGGTISAGGATFVNNTSNAAMTLTLTSALGGLIIIKDIAGNAGTYPITVSCSAGIDAGTTQVLSIPYQWVLLIWNGSSYSVIG